jgi:hypothetical protein
MESWRASFGDDELHNQAARIDDVTMQITPWEAGAALLRVAASSNPAFQRTAFGSR